MDIRKDEAVPNPGCALALMAKAPRVGQVKTRLVPPLCEADAAELSRCFIRDMATNIAGLAEPGGHHGVVAFAPAGDSAAFDGLLPPGFRLLPQRGAHLGERLFHATEDLLAAGFAAVCLINADSPTLPRSYLAQAAALLRRPGDRVVLGEAEDGGYYLVGLKRAHRHLFHRIDWSTERVFAQSIQRAIEIGLDVEKLAPWYDVDDAPTLQRLYWELLGSAAGATSGAKSYAAPQTSRFLAELVLRNTWLLTPSSHPAEASRL
jgi:rSAM/selenodomain-associated transferase 1